MKALEKEIQKLPKPEKIGIMELEVTEKRIQEGKEHFQDWIAAKEAIRRA